MPSTPAPWICRVWKRSSRRVRSRSSPVPPGMPSMPVCGRVVTPNRVLSGATITTKSPFSWPTDRRGLELLLACPAPPALLQLDRAAAGPSDHLWRELQCGRSRADPLLAEPLAQPSVARDPLPTFTFDAGYDAVQLSLTLEHLPVRLVVRLRAGRCFYANPTAQPQTRRPRRHGAKFVPTTSERWIFLSMMRLMLKRLAHAHVQRAFHYRHVA